jgi:hypothetical protein
LKKFLRATKTEIILLAAIVSFNCGKEEPKKNYIARVDDSYLTIKNLAWDLDTSKLQESRKNEYIRNWIETELLYKEAVKEDILDEDIYKLTLEKARKELAKSLLLQKFFKEQEIEYGQKELVDYYNSHKNEFNLFYDSYLYNFITFKKEDKAILFRSTLLESDWNRTSNGFAGDSSIISERTNILSYDYQIQPAELVTVIQELLPNEVSIVLNLEPNQYTVVQMIKKYSQGEIPDYEIVKKTVEDRFLILKRQELLKDFLRQLYLKYSVEIKQGTR